MVTSHGAHTVAIVGGGAIGAAVLDLLVDKLSAENSLRSQSRIVVFEKSARVGPGLAYASDPAPYVTNQSAQTMSLVPGRRAHFCEWLDGRGLVRCDASDDLFCQRQLFGDYVEERVARALETARAAGIAVTVVRDEVSSLAARRPCGYRVTTRSHSPIDADVAVLAIGNLPTTKFRDLERYPGFIASPYPSAPMCTQIPVNARVAILGSGLSAVDAVLALVASGHQAPIAMASRSGLLPAIRGPLPTHELRYVTHANIAHATDHGRRPLRWREVLHWLELELGRDDLAESWDRDFPEWAEPIAHYTSQLAEAKRGARLWQVVGEALNPMIEVIWHHLDHADKKLFHDHLYSRFMSHWVPIPILNGERILSLLQGGMLTVERGFVDATFDADAKCFRLHHADGSTTTCDHLVNATGVPRQISDCDSPLLDALLRQSIIRAHEFGGMSVDFDSLRVLGSDGRLDPSLFALGNLTSGTHLFTSTLELNVEKAERVAGHVVSELLRRTTKDHARHVDVTPHST